MRFAHGSSIAMCLVLVFSACKGAESSEPKPLATEPAPAAQEPPPAQPVVHKIGETVTADYLPVAGDWTVLDVKDRGSVLPETDEDNEEKTAGRFVQLHFRFTNTEKQAKELDTPKLIDSQGRRFDPNTNGADHLPGPTLWNEHVPPGIPTEFWAMYEVPLDASGLRFEITRKIVVDLGTIPKAGDKKAEGKAAPAAAPPDEATLAACNNKERSACTKACDGGDIPSCLTLGKLFWNEKDKSLQQQCREPLEKACNANVGKACTALSDCLGLIAHQQGQRGSNKVECTALELKACDLNDGPGCTMAGQHVKDGYGVEADEARGQALIVKGFEILPKACDAGDDDACYALASAYQWGTFEMLPKSPGKAAVYSKKACNLGNQDGCFASKNWH